MKQKNSSLNNKIYLMKNALNICYCLLYIQNLKFLKTLKKVIIYLFLKIKTYFSINLLNNNKILMNLNI